VPFQLFPFLKRSAIAGLGALATFVLVFLGFYFFRMERVIHVFAAWSDFIQHAGGERGFWESSFEKLTWYNRYGVLGSIALAAVVVRLVLMAWEGIPSVRRSFVLLVILAALVGGVWAVIKRPAGSTYYEVINISIVLAAMAVGCLDGDRLRRWAILGVTVALVVAALVDAGSVGRMARWVRHTSAAGEPMWRFHQEMLERGKGRPVVVIVPDNSHNYAGPEELLLKGFSLFPTWEPSHYSDRWLHRLAPGLTYRFETGQISVDADFPPGAAVVWFESSSVPRPPVLYPCLAELPRRPDVSHFQWSLRSVIPNQPIEAHICLLPE
jgi:hypothetical protein